MQKVIILTENEYQKLLTKKDEPNKFLEQELTKVKAELHILREYKTLYDEQTKKIKVSPIASTKQIFTDQEINEMYNNLLKVGYKKTEAYTDIAFNIGKSNSTVRRILKRAHNV